jgi:hypothetical protein
MNVDLAVQGPDDAQAFWILLSGQIPGRSDRELAGPFATPQTVFSLLEGLEYEEVIGGDELHSSLIQHFIDLFPIRRTHFVKSPSFVWDITDVNKAFYNS